jgi:fatty-acyl-CoA synthase
MAPPLPPAGTLPELLEWHVAEAPEHEAAVTAAERLSYAAWQQRSARVGAALAAKGIGRGDAVALLADNRAAWLEVAMGAAWVGARLVGLNTWAKAWDLEYMVGHARPRILFTVDRIGKQDFLGQLVEILPELWDQSSGRWRSERFPDLQAVVIIGDEVPPGAESFQDWTRQEVGVGSLRATSRPDDIAMVMFTSGSTARPKAVPFVHRHLIENGFHIGERQGLTSDDRVFLASPLFWSFGGANALMAAMTHRSTLVLQSQFRAADALDILESERCTSIYTLPAMSHALLGEPLFSRERLASVRTGLTIGPPEEIRLVAERLAVSGICNIYGASETYGNCCVTPTDAPLERRAHTQGPPLPGVELKIVDAESRQELPAGEVGEILVRGRITPGYLDESGAPTPVVDDNGFYATGDLGRLDADGWITFEGRLTEMIKTAGINVSPSEVEDFLSTHPDVSEAAVAGGSHPIRGEQVVAFVRFKQGATTTPEALREYCRERIAGYKAPAVIRAVDEFPLTDTGKLARRKLKAWADSVVAETPPEGRDAR